MAKSMGRLTVYCKGHRSSYEKVGTILMNVRRQPDRRSVVSNIVQISDAFGPRAARLLSLLADNARITNASLAERAGMPASTCLNHVQALRSSGLIAGHHTQIDRRHLGLMLDVLIGLQLKDKRAATVHTRMDELQHLPYVTAVMRTSGAYDLMIQAQVRDTDHLISEIIDPITEMHDVGGTQTILVHEHWQRMSLIGRFFHV